MADQEETRTNDREAEAGEDLEVEEERAEDVKAGGGGRWSGAPDRGPKGGGKWSG